ncbi:MFS transporter [Marine Group I thaumarchaeote]|uniref:MFS transporter n=1 Tax=Marine Group I thaumarchaeote TaxID=2511932 RepID=A0A7K4NIF0_9ARCH|nr:MAG: MFS transporter [Nitrosopumilus sp. YT1]NMI82042.1 MFS transporter [Candidatus Nitrosopumilus sp. MTA1]NWJ20255.1 MFS transporter [Marine Group I thaumarchaeote]NWJ28547.1 MFS transporter [Marine Group I thaumarchaeote]NWJ57170.1 MFS transporter [Marine Group I thaumarchaeote]
MQKLHVTNLLRSATFFQHAGVSIVFVFMPIIAKGVTDSILEIGLIVASFSFAQILSEIYFGRHSDKKGTRLKFIRIGFIGCAAAFGLHYFADDMTLLFLARIGAGIASGIMIPAMIAYAYELNVEKKRAATIISFHALGWLAGIAAAGFANDLKLIFLISAASFVIGLMFTIKLPNISQEKELEPGTTKKIIIKNKFLFLSLLLRHIGAAAVWTILPLMLIEKLGAELYQISIIYVANTLTAFILMNLMASRINFSNITKFKIGIGCTVFVFIGLSVITEWWMAMPFMALVGATWAFLFIGGNFHLMENNPRSTSTGIFSSTLSIGMVIGPIIAGSIAFAFDYIVVIYFAIAIIVCAFVVSLKVKI